MGCGSTRVKQGKAPNVKEEEHKANEEAKEEHTKSHESNIHQVIFVVGGPGSGKGTQCDKMVKEFGFVHLSTGDVLREESNNKNNPRAELISHILKEGGLVSSELLVELIKSNFGSKKTKQKILLDGFPRSQENIDVWNNVMGNHAHVEFLLMFTCSENTMHDRLVKRGETSGRSDDNEESIKKRLEMFRKQTEPIIEEFKKKGLLVEISSENHPDSVFEDVKTVVVDHHLDK